MPKPLIRSHALGFAAAALCLLSGCARPPAYTATNHQRVVPLALSDVWRRLHEFLQDQDISVVSEDRAAGIIDARQAAAEPGLLAQYADCGAAIPNPLRPKQRQTLDLTILVRPTPDGTRVTANAAFSQTLRAKKAGGLTEACASTGVLEAAVLNVASGQPMEAAVVPR